MEIFKGIQKQIAGLLKNNNFLDVGAIAAIIILSVWAGWQLLQSGFYFSADSTQILTLRQMAVEACVKDFQIPCRWSFFMGFGYGMPYFNYYPILPYVLGEFFRLLGFGFIATINYSFFASIVLSGFFMYRLGKEFWGRLGGLVSAALYIWAPYRGMDIFARSALNESWSFVWFPLIFLSAYRLAKERKAKWVFILGLSLACLICTHVLMALAILVPFLIWIVFLLVKEKRKGLALDFFTAGIWGLALSAFFWVPVLFERGMVKMENLTTPYFDYRLHFISFSQLLLGRISENAANHAELVGPAIPHIGLLYWVGSLLVAACFSYLYYKHRLKQKLAWVVWPLFFGAWFSVLMVNKFSLLTWVWFEQVLRFMQFPWRFLAATVFEFSILLGGLLYIIPYKRLRVALAILMVISSVALGYGHFTPFESYNLQDEGLYLQEQWNEDQANSFRDFIPQGVNFKPDCCRKDFVEVLKGNGSVSIISSGTNWVKFNSANSIIDPLLVRLNFFWFPSWSATIDGSPLAFAPYEDKLARKALALPQGDHVIFIRLNNTWPRILGNSLTLLGIGIFLISILIKLLKPKFGEVK